MTMPPASCSSATFTTSRRIEATPACRLSTGVSGLTPRSTPWTNDLAGGERRGAGNSGRRRAADLTGGAGDALGPGRAARRADAGGEATRAATCPTRGRTAVGVLRRSWLTARFPGRRVAPAGRAGGEAGAPVVAFGEMAIDRRFLDLDGVPEVADLVEILAAAMVAVAAPSIGVALTEDRAAQTGQGGDQTTEDPPARVIHSQSLGQGVKFPVLHHNPPRYDTARRGQD